MTNIEPYFKPFGSTKYQVGVHGRIEQCRILFPDHDYHHGCDTPFNLYTIDMRMIHNQTASELTQLVEVLRHEYYNEMDDLKRMEWDDFPADQRYDHPDFIRGDFLHFQSKFPPKLSGKFLGYKRDQEFIEQDVTILCTIQFQKDLNVFFTPSSVDPFTWLTQSQMDEDDGHYAEDEIDF